MPQSPYQQYEETSFVNTAPFTSVKSRCTVLAVPGAHAVPRRSLMSQRALNGERLDAHCTAISLRIHIQTNLQPGGLQNRPLSQLYNSFPSGSVANTLSPQSIFTALPCPTLSPRLLSHAVTRATFQPCCSSIDNHNNKPKRPLACPATTLHDFNTHLLPVQSQLYDHPK